MRRLASSQDGAAVVEFALVAPVFLLALLGVFDLSYNMYTSSLLEGSIQKAARDSSLEGAASALDADVAETVRLIVPDADIQFTRSSYADYADVSAPEDFTDINSDGRCDDGEPFEDVNGNAIWDADRGIAGFGGARDAVLYVVTVTYDRPFPVSGFVPGMSKRVTTTARAVLRNQPFGQQTSIATVGNC
ncbi:MAG: TadE/TadG family type IV pilus assembly protein [Alteraurantiacibacter sp.]